MAGSAGFDADARAQERESGPVKIGGVVYYPARLTNRRLREVRSKSRAAGIEVREAVKKTKEYKEAFREAKERGEDDKAAREIAEAEGQTADEVIEISERSLKEQLPVLLKDENGKPPTAEAIGRHLEEDLDQRDVEGLMSHLLGSDPTPEAAGAQTS